MTTENRDYRVELAPDLFEPNECINLPRMSDADIAADLACITLSRSGTPERRDDIVWSCVVHAWTSVLQRFHSLTCWLHACICVDDTRVARHRGLWKVLAAQGVEKTTQATEEILVENSDGTLCLYGAAAIEGERMELFRPVVSPASRSFLALLPDDQIPALDLEIAMGWKRGLIDLKELRDIALVVSKQGGIVLRLFGEFDDREMGVDCIMSSTTYERALTLMEEPH